VTLHLFDCLHDGDSLLDDPLAARLDRLDALIDPIPGDIERARHQTPDGLDAAETFYREALSAGHEGVMCKNPEAAYTPGRRVDTMAKVKPTMEPLDLVVTRAKYSEGRRSEQLGRLYLACYDADQDALREVGRLSTGYTDEELAALTERLEPLIRERDGRDVDLDPAVVLEVEYEEIQESTEYGSGYALRFPRFLGVRGDIALTDADTHERVERLYEEQQ
jgi:DNA ligase-1